MSKTFVTADQHFGHSNIIKHCNRPFASARDMDSALIKNWNSVVGKEDLVYVVGDFCWCKGSDYLNVDKMVSQLNGRKILILGNHDNLKSFAYVAAGFESAHTSFEIGTNLVMVHDPASAVMFADRKFILHGHIHGLWDRNEVKGRLLVNVGVDVHGFKPIPLAVLVGEAETLTFVGPAYREVVRKR